MDPKSETKKMTSLLPGDPSPEAQEQTPPKGPGTHKWQLHFMKIEKRLLCECWSRSVNVFLEANLELFMVYLQHHIQKGSSLQLALPLYHFIIKPHLVTPESNIC